MATALHKMASLDADPQQYKLLGDRPELTRLKDMICEWSLPLNQLLPFCVLQTFKAACTCELQFILGAASEQGRGHQAEFSQNKSKRHAALQKHTFATFGLCLFPGHWQHVQWLH